MSDSPKPQAEQGVAPPARVLLIVNTRARRGRHALAQASAAFEAAGVACLVEQLTPDADVAALIARHASSVDAVAIAGGDGSLNAAAAVLAQTGLPLGVLPAGTANDLARTLALPLDIAGAARIVAGGRWRTIDLGLANGRPFFNVVSVGLSVLTSQGLSPAAKQKLGPLAYPYAVLKALRGARPFTAQITGAGWDETVQTCQVSIGNGRYYGGGVPVASQAAIDDGRLDLYSLESTDVWGLAAVAPYIWSGRQHAARGVRVGACNRFEIRTGTPLPVSLDGEVLTETPLVVTLHRNAVKVFTA